MGSGPIDFSYRWLADGVEIAGEVNSPLDLTVDQLGAAITVEVTRTKEG